RARGGGRAPASERAPRRESRRLSPEGGGAASLDGGARMIRILRLSDAGDRAAALSLRARAGPPAQIAPAVAAIIADVRERGDAALRELTERFDGARLSSLHLDDSRWDALAPQCPAQVRRALEAAHARVRAFHAPQVPQSYSLQLEDGGVLSCQTLPL